MGLYVNCDGLWREVIELQAHYFPYPDGLYSRSQPALGLDDDSWLPLADVPHQGLCVKYLDTDSEWQLVDWPLSKIEDKAGF
ncbi:hypothetical protein LJ739_11590 [Aestuariibacter halophilus]|uniref:Uncharacterized protein n=1 Tax=Fluctibacter halophilus TaxID=226011 RepID=A0ABS8GB00_9ALTE|nr:hypothetical protein [Aestuariibacter halophilus]MCC2616884.1 hypothetical protein [Aestuariibacter halophilus]